MKELSAKVSSEDGPQLKHKVSSASRTHRESGHAVPDLPAPGDALLTVQRVSKVFDGKVTALDQVSFQVAWGEFLLLVGPNQAGKTTLLRLIASEEKPTQGAILFQGFDSQTIKRKEIPLLRRKMGRIFPDSRLIDDLNVFDNVALSLRMLGRGERRIRRRVPELLEMVGIPATGMRFPPGLSSAEKQKAAIARALAGDPLLLLADEPTMNLDEESADEILMLLREANLLGTAVLLATRHVRLWDGMLPRMLRLEKGRPVAPELDPPVADSDPQSLLCCQRESSK
ncbi:MAG: ATP-binding cassette domain-containing protein [Candidatus Zixiibacteriota bacterium]|nr:MAG: ATP-binding cassette domain-containing protein [candidate division Zixibacteria bacterium]